MLRRKHISAIQLVSILLVTLLVEPTAFAVKGSRYRPSRVTATNSVTQDLSGDGQARDSAKQHISTSGEASGGDRDASDVAAENGITETHEKFMYLQDAWARDEGGTLALSLDDCIARALERNVQLKAASQDITAAEGQLIEAKAAYWPVMEYNYRMAPVPVDVDDAWSKFWAGDVTFFNSIHVGIGVPVMTFGQLHMAKLLAKGGVEAARIKTRQAEGDVIMQVKKVYYGIQLAKETIKLLNEAVDKLNEKVAGVGEFVEEEEGDEEDLEDVSDRLDPYDVLQMKAFKLELERRLQEAKQNMELAYDAMRMLLDLEPESQIELDGGTLKPKLASLDREEEFVDGGMKHQHEVKLLDIGVETRKRLYKLEKYKLLPRAGVGFFVDVGRSAGEIRGLQLTDDYNDPFNFTRAGFGLEVKGTIDFHGAYGRIKKARAEYHKAVYERMIARRALNTDIRKAYLEAVRARDNVARSKKEWSMANQMMFLSKVNVDIGIGDAKKFADSLKYLLLSRGRYFKAVFDYNMSLAELEKRIGRERYGDYVPTPDIDELEAFRYNGDADEEDGGWITLDGEDDTYGVQTEDGGTTMGDVNE